MKKRKIYLMSISAVMVVSISTNVVKADTVNTDTLYKNAYNATQNALTLRTQGSVNDARVEIKKLPKNMDWAIGEFSKQVDTVQHPILVNIVNSIKKAEKETNQTNINIAKNSIPNELTQTWKNSYSSAVDKIQQVLQQKALDLVKAAESEKTDEKIEEARTILNDLLLSDSAGIKDWTNSLISRLNNITPTTPSEPTVPSSLIEEKILETEIRKVINKQEGTLTEQDLLKVQSLDIGGKGIRSLKGLEYCKNLNWLNLGFVKHPTNGDLYNYVEDITPLENLTKLTFLNLSNNNIKNVDVLSNLINLKKIDLTKSNLVNINGLKTLKNLEYLGLAQTNIKNLDFIKNLNSLKSLDLMYVNLNDEMFNVLKECNNLQDLSFYSYEGDTHNDKYVEKLRKILVNTFIFYNK